MKKASDFLRGNLWLIIVGLGIFLAALYFGSQKSDQQFSEGDITYEFAQARIGDIDVVVSGVGQIQAAQQVDLKAVAAGEAIEITAVHVKNNERVTKGQLLVSLDDRTASRRVYDAGLALQSAHIKQRQIEDDFDNKTVDDKRQRQLQEVAVSERVSDLVQARDALGDFQIRSPFDGILTDLTVSSGDSITRTDKIASVITDENIVAVTLNEVDALSVTEGNAVTLTFDALQGTELTGQVSRVDTIGVAEQGVVGYGVEIAIDKSDVTLRPGMSVNAQITAQSTEDVLIIPNSALKGSGQETYVEVQDGTDIVQASVEIGISNTFHTQIKDGLSVGDSVVTNTIRQTEDEEESDGLFGNLRIPGAGGGGPRR